LLLRAQDRTFLHEHLATLGDTLAISRVSTSAGGFAGRTFDVGAYEKEEIDLIEVDTQGRQRRCEVFAAERLGDAIARLYERYADLLPDGPARIRAAATARSVATALTGPYDAERYASMLAPAVEVVDHRTLGTWSARGAEAVLAHLRAMLEVADDVAFRDHEVLGLRSDALLTRRTHAGTARAGGGAYERLFLILWVFGTDGLQMRGEYFDADRDAEALARFDKLAAEPPATARITNAATRARDRLQEAFDARDWDAFGPLCAPGLVYDDRRRFIRLTGDRDMFVAAARWLASQGFSSSRRLLATAGDRLALEHIRWFAGTPDAPDAQVETLHLTEVDPEARLVAVIVFDPDDRRGASAELLERSSRACT
jgi:hypothetical protein